jgi:D-beta-D-heptose 7-phosphate kinase/D-beta-D-heptose 1-phosphate adenosyltransferase
MKTVSLPELARLRRRLAAAGKTLVWTNGCFDLLHAGHAESLAAARALGDALVVGLNSDRSVQTLKGPERPFVNERDRAALLSALTCVDYVLLFDGARCADELAAVAPDVYAKSADYTLETLDPDERRAVEAGGGRIVFLPLVEGLSSSNLAQRIRRDDPERIISAVFGLIRDDRGRLLLVANRYPAGIAWGLPGGGQRRGERLDDALRRELREEIGVEARAMRYAGVLERIDSERDRHLVLHLFAVDIPPAPPVPNARENIVAADWFDAERLASHPEKILGRRPWIQYLADPDAWPPYSFMGAGEE